MQPRKNIADIESLRPTLSTIAADKRSPGISERSFEEKMALKLLQVKVNQNLKGRTNVP